MLEFLPLVLALGLIGLWPIAALLDRLDRVLTTVALSIFGDFVAERRSTNRHLVRRLAGAHRGETYRGYAAKTFLFTAIVAVAGSVLGVYAILAARALLLAAGLLERLPFVGFLAQDPAAMGVPGLFVLFLVSSATVGAVGAYGTYQLRWLLPRYVASERARHIDTTLKRNVAFLFALSRSGMPFTDVLGTLADHTAVYGETAQEFAVTVREIELLDVDLVSAIEETGDRTPNEHLSEFAENLASVLRSGGSLTDFLDDQYEYFLEEEGAQQERFIELLGALAEAYVTVFVAGMLFLVTILVVVGLLLGGTLGLVQVLVYVVLGLANLGFVIYLDTITEDVAEPDLDGDDVSVGSVPTDPEADREPTSHAERKNYYRLWLASRLRPLRQALRDPIRVLTERPRTILLLTVPIALLWVLSAWWPSLAAGTIDVAILDEPLIQATLFVTGTYAVTYEVGRRRVKKIEAAIPDFLERLAATNEAGMSMIESFGRVARSDLGALTTEMRRTWADIQWGAHVEDAFDRFEARIRTPAITRVTTLTTNAMGATNDIGPVLRVAADEAKSARRLERNRRNELVTYVVVVYVAFFVFLGIVLALDQVFIPSIPTGLDTGGGGGVPGAGIGIGGSFGELTEATKAAYSLVFFHAGLIQGYVSGFVAGQMSEGRLASGAKHATIMLAMAYAVFLLFG